MSQHHDPVHPDSDHLSAELIADFEEGLLDVESTTHVEQHLADCEACRALQALLHEVTDALATLPPVSMPMDVETQLLAAVTGVTGGSTGTESTTSATSRTVTPIADAPSRRRDSFLGRSLGVAASVAVVLAVGALIYPSFVDNDSTDTTTAAEGDGTATAATATEAIQLASYSATTSGTDYDADTLGQQVNQLILGHQPAEYVGNGDPSPTGTPTTGPSPTGTPTTGSATPTTSTSPTDAVTTSPAASTPLATPTTSDSVPSSRALKRAMDTAIATSALAARECVQGYLELEVAPLAFDIGTFDGRAAAVIVLPSTSASWANVWVLDPRCSGIDAVLHYAQVPLS